MCLYDLLHALLKEARSNKQSRLVNGYISGIVATSSPISLTSALNTSVAVAATDVLI